MAKFGRAPNALAERARADTVAPVNPYRISFWFLLGVLVLTGWLHLGTFFLSTLFSFYVINKMNFIKPGRKWVAVAVFIVLVGGMAYGLAYLVNETAAALPAIAEKALPSITQWASEHRVTLPFTDLQSMKDEAINTVRTEAGNLGKFADFARGATTEFIYLTLGCMVAMALFLNPTLNIDAPANPAEHNLYSLCCLEITKRFKTFYDSFDLTMNAQVLIAVTNTVLTGVFMAILGLPNLLVALGITLVTGLVPFVGNLISSAVLIAIGFVVSATDGLITVGFVCLLHYVGFAVSSKIIGRKIHTTFWITLVALVVGESLMGVTGIVLAPVMLHYVRVEASRVRAKK